MLCWLSSVCVVVGMVFLYSGVVDAGYEKTCTPERRREGPGARSMCGSRLTEALSLVCGGMFSMGKRSSESFTGGLKDIISNKRDALDYLGKRDNGLERVGVVCECCYHKCNFNEMREYCVSGKKRNSGVLTKPANPPSLDALDRW